MLSLIPILVSLTINDVSAASACSAYKIPGLYTKMKQDIDKNIEKFANKASVAQAADSTLSKLITAKSPFVTSWYQKGNFSNKTEEEVAIAWRQYYARNFLLMKYPQDDKINKEIELLVDTELKKYFTSQYKKKIEGLFNQAKELSILTINEMKVDQSKAMIDRVKSIKLYWPENLKSARNNSMPLDLLDWGIAYDPVPNEINIGLGSLAYDNDENYVAVFAHEIGHSIDSCRWGAFFEGAWPFAKVGECLRSDKSVNAKKRDDSLLEAALKSGKISAELVNALKANPTCNKIAYPPQGVQADQLPETFADWFSAEVVSHLKNLDTTKIRADLCEEKILNNGSSYVSNQLRQEKIYFANPKIRKNIIGTDSKLQNNYCDF